MGFLSGRVTCCRFRVGKSAPRMFGPEHLEKLEDAAIGRQRVAMGDGSQMGWIAGDHILDTKFELEKNIVNGVLQFALRVDEIKIPGDLLRAYAQVELEGLSAENPSGHPSAKQRREARLLAKEKLEQEAKDGRFLRRKSIPVLWDSQSNELLYGSASITAVDRLHSLFKQSFDRPLEFLGAGKRAFELAEPHQTTRAVDDATPTAFVASHGQEIAWVSDETNRDFLGNEFLLWLWHFSEHVGDSIKLSDDSDVIFMIARSMSLECPRGQTGKESISSDAPGKLPESLRALQSGKLPRKVGLTLVRHGITYEVNLQAETLTIGGAKLPVPEEGDERARLEERVDLIRSLLETIDLTYEAFLLKRLTPEWKKEHDSLKKWLSREPKGS
ncbi:MAG: hypothetical protein K2X38_12325 [Gemmataceae bacterium]|nr:hypothetical protein [Gemmataceae bacterium]